MATADPRMAALFERIRRVATSNEPVLVHGETGAGKEGVARALHQLSGRRAAPLETLNCAVLTGDLASSELFGHERGAFTGADRRRLGVFERADGGTVFLDEVGELDPRVQSRLLRLLETRRVRRIGAERASPSDFRLVSATHRNLATEIANDRFRRDLFYRIGVIVLEVPPLRQRPDDVELLAQRLLSAAAPRLRWSEAAMVALRSRRWPGNVRELRNVVGRVAALASGPWVQPEDLGPPDLLGRSPQGGPPAAAPGSASAHGPGGAETLRLGGRSLRDIRAEAIRFELRRQRGNVSGAARILGIARSTVYAALAPADGGS